MSHPLKNEVCLFYDGSTRGLTESGFMEMPGIEFSNPGLKGICLSPTPRRLLRVLARAKYVF